MASGIDIRTKSGVLQQLETFATPYYSIYSGKDLKFFHNKDDMDTARELLEDTLTLLEQNGTTASFVIRFYDGVNEKGKLTDANLLGSNTFRLNPANSVETIAGFYPSVNNEKMLRQLEAENQMLKEKLSIIEEEEEEEEEEAKPANIVGAVVNNLLQHPEVQSKIIAGLFSLIDKVLPMEQNKIQASIAGVINETDAEDILNELLKHCTLSDLKKLAELPSKNPSLFSILLTQLRSL